MTYRTVHRVTVGTVTVAVQRSAEWNEYRSRIVAPRELVNHAADGFEDDKESAIRTAAAMAEFLNKKLAG